MHVMLVKKAHKALKGEPRPDWDCTVSALGNLCMMHESSHPHG